MKKEIKLEVPQSWSGVSLNKYLQLKKDIDLFKDDDELYFQSLLYHFCGINKSYIKKIDKDVLLNIKNDLINFMNNTEFDLVPIIKINGKEYGFLNLSKMSYGEYLDLTIYDDITIDENWNKLMSILYRPIVKKRKYHYEIEEYTGEEDYKIFDEVGMNVHFGALSFFLNLSKTLAYYTLNCLIPETIKQIKNQKVIQKNGKDILHSIHLLEEKLRKLM